MAKFVTEERHILLQDEREVILRPLSIAKLKRFMKAWDKFEEVEDGYENIDVMIGCVGICIEDNFKSDVEGLGAGIEIPDDYRSYLEDVLDMDTIYEILDVCAGMKLNDENFQEAAQAVAKAQAGVR